MKQIKEAWYINGAYVWETDTGSYEMIPMFDKPNRATPYHGPDPKVFGFPLDELDCRILDLRKS